MPHGLGRLPAWLRRASWLALLGVGVACGEPRPEGDVPEPVQEQAPSSALVPSGEATTTALRRFLPDALRATRTEAFAHDAHVQISCAVCHEIPGGHGSHESVECADCHRASASATLRELSPEQCASCHHGTEHQLRCEDCHENRAVVQSEQQLALEVWPEPRTRTLALDHTLHASVACATCHESAPLLTPATACASCHEEHHTAEVRCASCHLPPPETAHAAESHLTCSGSGCHRAREVELIAGTRTVCLACHQDQEEHEPAGECIECHRVRPGVGGRLDR